ncbi:MAG: STAS/SEC14 domain-containing protein [Cytophagales bacterium]|nr:STAS/SEC14 domain-containing protein [Cytophagales bacterium]
MNTDYFVNLQVKLWLDNGVFRAKIFSETLDLSIAETGVRERLRICRNNPVPMLSDLRRIKHVDKEARAFLAKPESTVLISAGAFLVNNQLQRVLGNFFILIDKPEIPTRLFTDEAQALAWLQQFKNIRSTA